jgi:acyl carrier protein
MLLEQIQAGVIDVLKEVQKLSGNPCGPITAATIPINQLEGFDSLCSVEATVMVEEKLGCGVLCDGSIFISEDGNRPLSVAEISEQIQKIMKKESQKK